MQVVERADAAYGCFGVGTMPIEKDGGEACLERAEYVVGDAVADHALMHELCVTGMPYAPWA